MSYTLPAKKFYFPFSPLRIFFLKENTRLIVYSLQLCSCCCH